ncbi:DUF4357 domain-containing protein [Veillonella sp. VA139]|uniref:DUF4357 domain-containing protein n=1 Tax=Veillonella sp. VA139 TaxID=741830 RepID=UPI000F8D8949|nr:DUF4357 domain-containing protein [Veillonella sp. VA139]
MARGILYVMTTVVDGLVKIGKTGIDNFESRMNTLENNGYRNVVGLKRKFAIEVDDYDEKELLLDDIFSKSRLHNTELFALDIDLVIQLLSSFDGKQVYPTDQGKDVVFDNATKARADNLENQSYQNIPDGLYHIDQKRKDIESIYGKMLVDNGKFIVLKGSSCPPSNYSYANELRKSAVIKNGILIEDIVCKSPYAAATLVRGLSTNGWTSWKNESGETLDKFRK